MDRTKAYALLGLSPGASEGEIKKAYRLFALRTHPDRHSSLDAVSRFKEIKKAYDVLTFPVVSEPVVEPPAYFLKVFARPTLSNTPPLQCNFFPPKGNR